MVANDLTVYLHVQYIVPNFSLLQSANRNSTKGPPILTLTLLFLPCITYYKALHQSSCFSQKVETAGWCNDYGIVRVPRSIVVVIMKARLLSLLSLSLSVNEVLLKWR